jgi:hypothetical protein
MAKVDVHLGFTFRVGPLEQNQYGRVDLTVSQIDTELPVEPQLEESKKIADVVWEFVKGKIDSEIEEVLDSSS